MKIISSSKSEYTVGDVISYVCTGTRNGFTANSTCTSEGKWTSLVLACTGTYVR
ncbi:hypothetical protein DPMN_048210 [Dreissena polymorpha]|uniref:Sushi domain-containing protein n=1 Tax=Dreissena polymorpha TaxID=45954 RepID=A0A9D4DAT6_DREPO|nr:hypothetical protein DPMN_048210 [Dreissena polymorpha]